MPANVFFDTSVLVYVVGQVDCRTEIAEQLLVAGGVISVQVLNELVAVGRGKLGLRWKELSDAIEEIKFLCYAPAPLTIETHQKALKIAQRHKYHICDSLMIAAALQSGCSILYSEDMQDGQSIETLRIKNPFRAG